MANLIPANSFDDVPQLETTTVAIGGAGAPMNWQAQALLNRTEYLKRVSEATYRSKTVTNPGNASITSAQEMDGDTLIEYNNINIVIDDAIDRDYIRLYFAELDSTTLKNGQLWRINVQSNANIGNIHLNSPSAVNMGVDVFVEAGSYLQIVVGYLGIGTNSLPYFAVVSVIDLNNVMAAVLDPRYSINAQTGTSYTIVAADVTAVGRVIVKCSNSAAITVNIPTPSSLGATTGDSFNIRQGGLGALTLTGTGGATLEGSTTTTAQHETKTVIATSDTDWLVVGG